MAGTCIGERNHARYFAWLLAATAALGHLVRTVDGLIGEHYYHTKTHARGGPEDAGEPLWAFLAEHIHALLVSIVLCALCGFFGANCLFHGWLILSNTTAYEVIETRRVNRYLQGTTVCDLPYYYGRGGGRGNGWLANVYWTLMADGCSRALRGGGGGGTWKPYPWLPPSVKDLEERTESGDVCASPFENRYWSCC